MSVPSVVVDLRMRKGDIPASVPAHIRHTSQFLRTLHKDLLVIIGPEIEMTLRVAVLHASGCNRSEIVRRLGKTDLEVRMALMRLERVAKDWE